MKLSGTGPAHRLDECEISVQEQRISGGVQGPAKPAAVGFTVDKPASGSRPFEFCVPNAVCAPPGPKRAVSSRPFWPHHADFRRIRPQNRVGTSKSIVPPFGAKSNAFREKCKIPCKITGRASGPPGLVLAGLSQRRISSQARKSPLNPRILSC